MAGADAVIITAALPWYDEAPEDLDRYVRALPAAVDRLVAVDGGYDRYPGAKARSPKDEEAAIREAAADVGLPVEIIIPRKVWAGQVEKRTHLYETAAKGSDWLFTLDADHILHGIREAFRHEVESVPEYGIEVAFYTTMNHDLPLDDTAATEWHSRHAGTQIWSRLLLRALPGMRVERFHWFVSGLRDGQRVWLHCNEDTPYPLMPAHQLEAPMLVEHRCLFRRQRNILANREFCEDRVALVEETGQEDAVAV